jgi:hypothetical protein
MTHRDTDIAYAALDRHIEAIRRPRHICHAAPVGRVFLRGGPADGKEIEWYRYPAANMVVIPILNAAGFFAQARYELRTFVWAEDGYEARYDFAPSDTGNAKASRKSRRQ